MDLDQTVGLYANSLCTLLEVSTSVDQVTAFECKSDVILRFLIWLSLFHSRLV